MLFNSPSFIFVFFPAVFILSRLLKGTGSRNILLAAASLVFYAFGQILCVPLLLFSVLINYLSGVFLIRSCEKGTEKTVLAVSVFLNLAVLSVFKYSGLTALPLGISFFTFQGMSYVIDVYRERELGTRSFLKVFLYIAFFPRLISGPIVRYSEIWSQMDEREISPDKTVWGIKRFVFGLSKKVLLSAALAKIADAVFSWTSGTAAAIDWRIAWLGAVSYALQIYFDFSGYSDMAIGISSIFGFDIAENFNLPYTACSLRDFWRRWHISLSQWFREYLYIPLGGNRKGKFRAVINRLAVFLCTGIWHGANPTFIVWGLCHGILCGLEGAEIIPVKKLGSTLFGRVICRIYTLLAAVVLFVVFRADTLGQAFNVISSMFSFRTSAGAPFKLAELISPMSAVVIALSVFFAGRPAEKLRCLEKNGFGTAVAIPLFILCLMSISRGGFAPFIYLQF